MVKVVINFKKEKIMKNKKVTIIKSYKEYIESDISNDDFKNSGIVYCRVSTESQIKGTSLDSQMNNGIEFFKNSDYKLKNIIVFREEGKSGDDYDKDDIVLRPLLRLILNKIENGLVKYFWVLDNSRLSRNGDLTSLIHKKLKINNVKFFESGLERDLNNLTESMFMKILSVFDEYENHKRFQKSVMGKVESLRKNKWIGGTYPFGFIKGKENGDIVVDRKNKKYVTKIFEMCKNGKSTKEIVLFLNKENVKSPKTKSGVWNDQTIRNILRSKKYIGKHIVEQKLEKNLSKEECREKGLTVVVEQKFDRIISDELFYDVQKITDKWNSEKISNRNLKYDYLIRDIVYCSCGNKMKIKQNKKMNNWKVYFCDYHTKKWRDFDNRVKECGRGKSKFIHLEKLETLVWNEVLKTFYNSHQIREQFKNSVLPQKIEERNIPKQKIEEYEKYIKSKKFEIKKIQKLKIDRKTDKDLNILTKKEFNNLIEKYDRKIEELETLIINKEIDIKETQKGIEWYDWMIDFKKKFKEISNYKTFKERKSFIQKHINKVVIKWNKNNNTHKITIHFNIPIVKDERLWKEKYVFELMKGKNEKVINKFDHLFLCDVRNNYLKPNIVSIPIQQSLSSFRDNNLSQNNSIFDCDKDIILEFKLDIISSKLTKTTHYTSYQQKLYRLIKFLKEERNLGYRRISRILFEKNYRSIRSNKILKHNYIYSIYYKGKIRENRINREFDSIISDVELKIISKK